MNHRNRELSVEEQAQEIQDEFLLEATVMPTQTGPERQATLTHINALLDAYLDMWPELLEV